MSNLPHKRKLPAKLNNIKCELRTCLMINNNLLLILLYLLFTLTLKSICPLYNCVENVKLSLKKHINIVTLNI